MDVAYEINFDIDGFLRSFELQRRAGRGDADRRRAAGDRTSEQIERRFGAERRTRRDKTEMA